MILARVERPSAYQPTRFRSSRGLEISALSKTCLSARPSHFEQTSRRRRTPTRSADPGKAGAKLPRRLQLPDGHLSLHCQTC
jgi:hypothetical protein